MVRLAAARYGVHWTYENAMDAMHKISKATKANLKFTVNTSGRIVIESNLDLFGKHPYVVAKIGEEFRRLDSENVYSRKWVCALPAEDFLLGIAGCDASGNVGGAVFEVSGTFRRQIREVKQNGGDS
jgi:hypothetical protein